MAEMIDDTMVRTVGLTKTFRDFWLREKVTAVKDLDLSIQRGEVYGLLGPNGSGKSTTIKMMLGLMFPSRGRVLLMGKAPTDVGVKKRIGFLPEESYLYPFLNAEETLDYYGRLFGQPRAERQRRIGMLLDMVGLSAVAWRRVGEYSKGMQRRIGMAQALINDPDLLILDEPTSGMDPLAARQFKDLIMELSRRGKTIILSSHLLADMEDVCHRVGILYAGQLRSEGRLDELLCRTNLTQIITEQLPPATLEAVLHVLRQASRNVLSVEAPKDKLEALFLRIVRQAQAGAERLTTAALVETGNLAEFLRADSGAAVIDSLLQREPAPVEAAPAPAIAPTPQPSQQVLEELLKPVTPPPGEAAQPATSAPAAPAAPRPQPQVDRGLLDSLTQDREK